LHKNESEKDKKVMNEKKRFAINAFAQIFSFTVSLSITFFLTPYIVSHLGTAAYGFVGLAQNFVSYAQLITIALNSMAGRVISNSYNKGNN
jgi:O-antigen/teichoic acid export membrane protein